MGYQKAPVSYERRRCLRDRSRRLWGFQRTPRLAWSRRIYAAYHALSSLKGFREGGEGKGGGDWGTGEFVTVTRRFVCVTVTRSFGWVFG